MQTLGDCLACIGNGNTDPRVERAFRDIRFLCLSVPVSAIETTSPISVILQCVFVVPGLSRLSYSDVGNRAFRDMMSGFLFTGTKVLIFSACCVVPSMQVPVTKSGECRSYRGNPGLATARHSQHIIWFLTHVSCLVFNMFSNACIDCVVL